MNRAIRLFTVFAILVCISKPAAGQTSFVDSLRNCLKTAKDTMKIRVLEELAWELVFSDMNQAEKYADQAYKLATSMKWQYGILQAHTIYGLIHYQKSEYDEALKYYLLVLRQAEDYNDNSLIAKAYTNLGNVYNKQKQYDIALDYYLKSYELKMQTGEKKSLPNSLINIGSIYFELGDPDKGAEYFTKAIPYCEMFNNNRLLAIIYGNLGLYYRNKEDYPNAKLYYRKSIGIREKINDLDGLGNIYLNLGALHNMTGEYEEARKFLEAGIEISRKLKNKNKLQMFYRNYAEYFNKTGNYKEAYENSLKSVLLGDSVNTEQTAKKIAELQAIYDNDKKQKEIELLKKESMLRMYENERQGKEIEILNSQNKLREAEAINKTKTIALLTEQKKVQEIEKQKNEQKIARLSTEQQLSEMELRKNTILMYSFSALFVLVGGFSWYMYKAFRQKKKSHIRLALQNEEIIKQKEIIEEKNGNILSSIHYARLIQDALLPKEEILSHYFSEHCVLYMPKDIVSGDFYWIEEARKKDHSGDTRIFFSAVDCTGHGVPGAFMSIVGYNNLNKAIKEYKLDSPGEILNFLNIAVNESLRKEEEKFHVKDGMDLAICSYDPSSKKMIYAGAYNPLWILKSTGEFREIKADKIPVGGILALTGSYTEHEVQLEKGDTVFVFSDGYADQFGGAKGKKFKYSQLKEVMVQNRQKPLAELKVILQETLVAWKGNLEQVDDILVMGVRV